MTTPDPSPGRVTLRDIATKLGISHSSVSLALRSHPRISKALTKKIQDTAREMGYRPDPMLAALAHYRQGKAEPPVRSAIAWINAWPDPDQLKSFREFDFYWRGASAAAEKMGYYLEEFRLNSAQCPPARLEQILRARGIRGILIPPHPQTPDWGSFDWSQFCAVRFGRSCKSPNVHIVGSDQLENTILAYNAMRERGYKRIGFITGQGASRGVRFYAGYFMAQQTDRQGPNLKGLVLKEPHSKLHPPLLKEWLASQRPDAILTDSASIPGLLEKAGYRVPEDVGLAVESVLDGEADAGVDQHPAEVGRVALLVVLSLLHDHASGVPSIFRQILVSGSWVDGKSLPPRL